MLFPDDVPRLTDGVVTLRAHTGADVPRMVEQCRDPQSIAWTTVPVPYAEDDAVEFVGTTIPGGWTDDSAYIFAIEVAGRFVGSIDLRIKGGGEAEIGFGLHPDARGDGVTRRALGLLLDWGFEQGVVVVHWRSFTGNWASRRTVWSLGFRFGPTIPNLLPRREERRDAWTGWLGKDDPRDPVAPWLVPPVLLVDGLRLRPWRESDASGLVEAANDAWLQEWVPDSPLPRTVEDVPGYLQRVHLGAATHRRIAWCVADAATDGVLGNVALFDFKDEADDVTAQVGYWSHPGGRGRGVLTAALRTVVHWAMTPSGDGGLGVRRLHLLTAAANADSRRLAERVGFVHVGTTRASAPAAGGGFEDNAVYDLLHDDARQVTQESETSPSTTQSSRSVPSLTKPSFSRTRAEAPLRG